MKVFLDSDVLLDFLLDRKPFSDSIAQLFQKSIEEKLQLCISPISMTNINYVIEKLQNKKQAKDKVSKIFQLVKIETICESTIKKAIDSDFKDFEDAVQNFCALEAGHKIILTRNTKDYKESELGILTPIEFLSQL